MANTANDTPATFPARIAGAGLLAGDVAAIVSGGSIVGAAPSQYSA